MLLLVFLTFITQCVNVLSLTENYTYCSVNGDAPGIIVLELSNGKDSSSIGVSSQFRDDTTKRLGFTVNNNSNWNILWSTDNYSNILNHPVLDQRWETFINSHDDPRKIEKYLYPNKNNSIFLSVRTFPNFSSVFTENKWYHLMTNGSKLFFCDDRSISSDCKKEFHINKTTATFFRQNQQSIWKLHKYKYLYTTKLSKEQIYYSKSQDCIPIENGCFSIYLTMCENCIIKFYLNSTETNMTRIFKDSRGNGTWIKLQLSVENFVDCFNITAETSTVNGTSNDTLFWAIGEFGSISHTLNCEQNIRYIKIDLHRVQTNLNCEDALNANLNLTFRLPLVPNASSSIIDANNATFVINSVTDKTPSPDSSPFNLLYLIIIIPVIIAIAAVLTYSYICKKKRDSGNEEPQNMESVKMIKYNIYPIQELNSKSDSIISTPNNNWPPIRSNDFASYLQDVFDRKEKSNDLQAQFSSLPSGYLRKWNEGKKPENLEKNRYAKICPYDDNRVQLEKNLDSKHQTTDYINASYVQGFNGTKEYIVTQNPLENTVIDFWKMIWQENVEYVIMISSTKEAYHCYWPELKTTQHSGEIKIYLEKVRTFEFYDNRVFLLRRYGQTRKVVQLHFHAWSYEMLSAHIFSEFMNDLLMIPHHSAPVVFHCLAGLGRSATILLCDIALRAVAVTGSYNLYAITKQLRHCRADMVQNLRQYQLAHLIILESLNYKERGIIINEDYEADFSRLFDGNSIKKMWSQYLENREWIYEAVTPSIICSKHPKRNRYTDNNLLPVEHSRVVLKCKQTDYIHAMYVYDYKQMKNIIVAQQPLHSTLSDFWLMVLQNYVTTIINLNGLDLLIPSDCNYFPTFEEKIIKLRSNITINFIAEEHHPNCDKIDVTVCIEGEISKKMCIINVKNWPNIKETPNSPDVLTSIWDLTKGKKIENFPILICCDDGIRASSLVACFFYMTDKMLKQHICDVVGAVRAVRRTRTSFINFEQFVFLHHCALAFYKKSFKQNYQ